MPNKPFDPEAAAREFTAGVTAKQYRTQGTSRNKLAAQRGADLNSAVATVMKSKNVSRLQAIQLLTDYAKKANIGPPIIATPTPKTPTTPTSTPVRPVKRFARPAPLAPRQYPFVTPTPAVTPRRPRARPTGTPTPRPTMPHNPIAGY